MTTHNKITIQREPKPNITEAKPVTLRDHLDSPRFKEEAARALPASIKVDRFIRVALTTLNRTPKLADCTQASVFECLLQLAALGIEADGRRAHLIPYGKECRLIVDYKGLAELVLRSGLVSMLHADVVCENDLFVYDRGEIKQHAIDFRKPRGAVYAAYAFCKMKDGSEKAEVMGRDEIEAVRGRSKSANDGPWVTDWNEMAKKTVFRRASKWLPLSPEIRDAVEADDFIDIEPKRKQIEIKEPEALDIFSPEPPQADPADEEGADRE